MRQVRFSKKSFCIIWCSSLFRS